MERLLIFIKHNFVFLWSIIDWCNGLFFVILFKPRLERILPCVFDDAVADTFVFRKLESEDIKSLFRMINAQPVSDLDYFKSHKFDMESLEVQLRKPAFMMMGAFEDEKLVGYFFLRFFANKKCFVGRLIDIQYRGKGIGITMNFIMYETSWRIGFRCLSTISKNNTAVMHAHAKNPTMIILKELQNDYLLVEFIRKQEV